MHPLSKRGAGGNRKNRGDCPQIHRDCFRVLGRDAFQVAPKPDARLLCDGLLLGPERNAVMLGLDFGKLYVGCEFPNERRAQGADLLKVKPKLLVRP